MGWEEKRRRREEREKKEEEKKIEDKEEAAVPVPFRSVFRRRWHAGNGTGKEETYPGSLS